RLSVHSSPRARPQRRRAPPGGQPCEGRTLMSYDTGHHAAGGYPPAAGTETDAIDVRDVAADKPFASLTTRDYVTDAVAAVLLLVSLSLTWRLPSFSPQPASDVAWALPVTLLALAALVLP